MGQLAPLLGFGPIGAGAKVGAATGIYSTGLKAAAAAASKAGITAPAAAKGLSVGSVLKGAAALAPTVATLAQGKPKSPGRPKDVRIDREAAEAVDRDRARRQREGQRSTILTGPSGAPGRALVGRTILSGG